ncbi:hypothetical protein [Sphingomonas sp. SRS2]|uniref:hypothetical protein n=1 Tax=Sphingomonas sp. SRS2 TaxID=133190 RepID=UPI0006184CD6|nr:hypothetical protein [Sphingomonas sp. SRS2]KKC24361.1 hypothetical protein WP12_19900 [Sphingomonas sp. SRS2]
MVGGQALNLWAEYYSDRAAELLEFRPYTSKDIDYYGQRDVAKKLADGLGGTVEVPDANDTTFQTAIVHATIGGLAIDIDFLSHVKGVQRGLEQGVADLILPYEHEGIAGEIAIRLMHPLHCLQSRVANVMDLGRSDGTSKRQLAAAPIVLREYINEALAGEDQREAIEILQALFRYLRSDITGRKAHRALANDPIDLFRHFAADERLDSRWREISLSNMITQLEAKRTILGRVKTALRFPDPPMPK